ncbi:MAG: leucine--tRNA ligase [Candidatus Micrarchaeota archaeon]|nr:leucine--tRNA ligase [Candidatus Micrarchaeota archaeon]
MASINFKDIEQKVSRFWEDQKLNQPETGKGEKKFITAAFPYPNSPQHIGHGRTYTITDIYARYLRMKGYNVLFPMAFHVTGTPILAMADRIREKDEELLDIFERIYHISRKESEKLTDPKDLVMYFSKEIEQGMNEIGLMIDWRRKFYSFDVHFNKFIEWQFRKLKEKGLIMQGEHYIPWSIKLNSAVGSHDTKGDVDPQMEQVVAIKFKFNDGYLVASTYRPETIFGLTNIWVNPNIKYVKAKNKEGEILYFSKDAAEILSNQIDLEIISEVDGKEFENKKATNPANGEEVPLFPASFVKSDVGTGIVMSVPAHAPFDYVALRDIGKENLSVKIIEVGNYGMPAKDVVEKFGIKDQNDPKLEEATKALYREEAHNGKMLVYKKGLPVSKAKEEVKEMLIGKNQAFTIWIIANAPVYSREGDQIIIKKVNTQWFINYGDKEWKDKSKKLLSGMSVIPEDGRKEMMATMDWLDKKACTRAKGLGTKFPFDQSQVIESLSDSTIYMSFYTIADKIKEFKPEELDESFFDYIFMGKGKPKNKTHEEMRKSFLYWYPLDSRHSGWDLVKNHLPFFIMNHCAIFEDRMLPRQIVLNGFVLMEGKKMSKSFGNILPLRDAIREYGADVVRFSVVAGAELIEDTDFSVSVASGVRERLEYILDFMEKEEGEEEIIDRWINAKFNRKLESLESNYDKFELRQISLDFFYEFYNDLNWYVSRKRTNPRLNGIMRKWARIMAPIMPFIAEHIWREKFKNKGTIFSERMPKPEKYDEDVVRAEELVKSLNDDIERLMGIVKKKPNKIYIYIPEQWKFELFEDISRIREMKGIMKEASAKYNDNMEFVSRVAKGLGNRLYTMEKPIPRKIMEDQLRDAKAFFSKRFGVEVIVENEENSSNEKAKGSTPIRPTIYLE